MRRTKTRNYYEHDGFLIYPEDEDYMKSAEPKTDSVDELEDAWYAYLPYRIFFYVASSFSVVALLMFFGGIALLTVFNEWGYGPINGLHVTLFVIGLVLCIIFAICWFFWMDDFMTQHLKWRKARRRFARAKD